MKKILLAIALFAGLSFVSQPKAHADLWCGNYNATPTVGIVISPFINGGIPTPYRYCVGNDTGEEFYWQQITWGDYWDLKSELGD